MLRLYFYISVLAIFQRKVMTSSENVPPIYAKPKRFE